MIKKRVKEMVSISNVSIKHAASYYQKDDFTHQNIGVWHGKGMIFLGLEGSFKREDYLSIIAGKDPKNGDQLIRCGVNGKHRAGVDLTFSSPKSISLAGLVLRDERVIKAHNDAVMRTLDHIEKYFTQARLTQNGLTEKINTANLIIAKFEHHLSREGDPQLHSHCLIMNMTKTQGGWRAVSNEKLYYHKIYTGQFFRNEISRNLIEIGFQIQTSDKGFFEIKGIDKNVLKMFSQRSEKISEKMWEMQAQNKYPKMNDQRRRGIATISSRQAKQSADIRDCQQYWNERLLVAGYTKDNIKDEIQRQSEKCTDGNNITAKAAIKTAIMTAEREGGTFRKEDVLLIAAKQTIGRHRFVTIDRSFKHFIAKGEIEKTENGRYTTPMIKDLENSIMKVAGKKQENQHSNPESEKIQRETFYKGCQDITENINKQEALKEVNLSRESEQEIEKDR